MADFFHFVPGYDHYVYRAGRESLFFLLLAFLLTFVIATGYRNVVGAFRRDQNMGRIRVAFFVAVIVCSFTEAAFRVLNPLWILFLLATAAVPEADASTVRSATPSRFRGTSWTAPSVHSVISTRHNRSF